MRKNPKRWDAFAETRSLSRVPELRSAAATPIEISRDHPEEHGDIQLRPLR
jgi:hypothetical protein